MIVITLSRCSQISGDLSTLGVDFFKKFDVVVIGYSSRATKVLITFFFLAVQLLSSFVVLCIS